MRAAAGFPVSDSLHQREAGHRYAVGYQENNPQLVTSADQTDAFGLPSEAKIAPPMAPNNG